MRASELVDALGEDGALALAEMQSGRTVYVPTGASDLPVWRALGVQGLQALQRLAAGEYVEMPTMGAVRRLVGRRRAEALLAAGVGYRETARRTGLSRRTVARVADLMEWPD